MGKPRQDLIGKTFYRLKVIERHGSDPKAGTLWLCQCNCGNKIIVSTCDLNKGRVKSCGCLRKKIASERVNKENYLKKYQIKDTNVTLLNSKLSKANKSGYKGVWYNKRINKYESYITFKKHKYHLGKYRDINDAIEARKKAEKMLFDDFLKWYDEEYKNNI